MYLSYSNKKACDYIDWSLESSLNYDEKQGILCLTYCISEEIAKNTFVREISQKYTEYKKNKYQKDLENYTGSNFFGYGKMEEYNLAKDLSYNAFQIYEDEDVIQTVSDYWLTSNINIITVIPEEYTREKITYRSLSLAFEQLARECRIRHYKSIIVPKSQFYRYDLEWEAVLPIIKDEFREIEIDIIVTEQ